MHGPLHVNLWSVVECEVVWSRGSCHIQSKTCYSCVFSSMWFFWHSPIHNQRGFLFSLPLPIISCFLSFNYVVVTSLCTWQPLELRFLSPPQHQSCYFKSMLSKHRHDGAWTLQDYRLPKGCWLHILHIIILPISYTQLALGFRLVCFFCYFLFSERLSNAFGSAAYTPLAFDWNTVCITVLFTPEICCITKIWASFYMLDLFLMYKCA